MWGVYTEALNYKYNIPATEQYVLHVNIERRNVMLPTVKATHAPLDSVHFSRKYFTKRLVVNDSTTYTTRWRRPFFFHIDTMRCLIVSDRHNDVSAKFGLSFVFRRHRSSSSRHRHRRDASTGCRETGCEIIST